MAFEKIKKFISRKKDLPGGLWTKCESCQGMIYRKELEEKKLVCPQCGYHFTMSPTERIELMLDPQSFTRMWTNLEDRKSTRLNSSHSQISYAVFCLKKK